MSQTWMTTHGACYVIEEPEVLESTWASVKLHLGWYRRWRDRETEEWVQERNRVTAYAYGYVAEFAITNLRKGDLIAIQAELRRGVHHEFKTGHNLMITNLSVIAKWDEGYRESHQHPRVDHPPVVD